MSAHFERGLLLLEQSRWEAAEKEFRQAVGENPQDGHTRALLGLTLSRQERFAEAEQEVLEALKADPGYPFVHYARAYVLNDRHDFPGAEKAIAEAIQLEPEADEFFALQSQIFLNQRKWAEALGAAEQGLKLNAEHVGCANLRAIALVKLGRKEEAGQSIDAALAKDPENSTTHANQGWTLLHGGKHKEALEHFRESLRLEPTNEWARQGIIEALKARNIVYALMLKYFLWMSRFSNQVQWGILIGGVVGMRLLRQAEESNPEIGPYVLPIQVLYLLFVFLSWTAEPLFNLALRMNRFGRMVLNEEEIRASNWIGVFVGCAALCLVGAIFSSFFLLPAMVFGFSVIPMAAVFKCARGWPRWGMLGYTAVVVGAGLAALLMMPVGVMTSGEGRAVAAQAVVPFSVFAIGILLSGWVGNFLVMQQVRK